MSLSNSMENYLLGLIFNGTAIPNLADNAASSPLTSIFIALHTADPGETGTQATSEAAYTSYARVAVARTTGGFPAPSAGAISPAANIDFPAGTGGSGTVTHFSAGAAVSGASVIYFSGTVTPNIVTGTGIIPRLTPATVFSLD